MNKIAVLVMLALLVGVPISYAWDTNPMYNPFEVVWNAFNTLLSDVVDRLDAIDSRLDSIDTHMQEMNAKLDALLNSTTASPEVCDGIDNDNDGYIDEDFADLGTACDGTDTDLCTEGIYICSSDGLSTECSDATGDTFDICNGFDDDCDPSSVDGSEDPDFGLPCDGPDTDFCLEGTYACNGISMVCSDETSSNAELCDGIDNDCDGVTDEDFADGSVVLSGALYSVDEGKVLDDYCGTGQCAGGQVTCSANGLSLECSTDVFSSPESCDDIDNNCDGLVDDGNACPKNDGEACVLPSDCMSYNCVDGVCCNTACSGTCESCVVGGSIGICTLISAGLDPDGECTPSVCTGNGACSACGDGICLFDETASSCPIDCSAVCGDGYCTHDENSVTCPDDC